MIAQSTGETTDQISATACGKARVVHLNMTRSLQKRTEVYCPQSEKPLFCIKKYFRQKKMHAIFVTLLGLFFTGCEAFSLGTSTVYSRQLASYYGAFRAVRPSSGLVSLRSMASDQERELSNEECDILNLPYGTKIIGDLSERLFHRLAFGFKLHSFDIDLDSA